MMPDRPHAELADLDIDLTDPELRAIGELQQLAKRWPKSLTLVSMDGGLAVIRTGDPRFDFDGGNAMERQQSIIAHVYGIPNDGGGW